MAATPRRKPSSAPGKPTDAGGRTLPSSGPANRPTPAIANALQRERARVAEVLHNTLCQELTGISLMASAAARQRRADCPEAERQFRDLAALIQRAGDGLREFVRSLHPGG